jgi:hypothetical protein
VDLIAVIAICATLLLSGRSVAPRGFFVQTVQAAPLMQEAAGGSAVPLINYQGRILDPTSGLPKPNGAYEVRFELFEADAGGAPLWGEIRTVTQQNGAFSLLLGQVVPLALNIFDGRALFLQVTLNPTGTAEVLAPRQPVAWTPYAIFAQAARNALIADTLDGIDSSALAAKVHGHDASEVNAGTLSNDRFSAYGDLAAESRIGTGATQVAPGSAVPLLKSVSWVETFSVDATLRYFTTNHLVVKPPANGYLLVHARVRYNCPGNVWTQSNFGIAVSTSAAVPTAATPFVDSVVMGNAYPFDTSSNGGDFNPNVLISPVTVTAGNIYHIWAGVDGVNIQAGCSASSPRLTATFHLAGM